MINHHYLPSCNTYVPSVCMGPELSRCVHKYRESYTPDTNVARRFSTELRLYVDLSRCESQVLMKLRFSFNSPWPP